MVNSRGLAVCLPLVVLAACGALPSVKYSQISAGNNDQFGVTDEAGLMRYSLAASTLVLDFKKDKDGRADTTNIELMPVPAESNVTLAVALDDKWGRATTLQWTKIPNTELLSTVGTEVTDNRVKVAKAVGETVTGLIGLSLFQTAMNASQIPAPLFETDAAQVKLLPVEPFPVAFDPLALKLDKDNVAELKRGAATLKLEVTFGGQQAGSGSLANLDLKPTRHVLIASACRIVTVKILSGSGFVGRVFTTKIADPRAYQTIPFPQKGSVKLHPTCGADVVASASTGDTDIEVVAAAVAQAKTILEAWKPKTQ